MQKRGTSAPYSIDQHKHRFAAWAAGRAASAKGCRFSVEQAKTIIEAVRLNDLLVGPQMLPRTEDMAAIPGKPLWHIEEHWPGFQ